jgi:hypothetical protein
MDFFNIGTGLTDIDATQVTTDYLVTDEINTTSGFLDFNNNNFMNVNLINGYDLENFNTKILFSSNLVVSTSNVSHDTSNLAHDTSNHILSGVSIQSTALTILKETMNTANVIASKLMTCSNLDVSNTLIRVNGSNLMELDKRIDYQKWIKNGPTFKPDNSMAVAALAIASASAVTSGVALAIAGRGLFTNSGNIAQDMGDSLSDLFDNDTADNTEEATSSKKYISFKNLKTIPNTLAYDRPSGITLPGGANLDYGSGKLAFRDHMYVDSSKKLYAVSSLNFSYDGEKNSWSFGNSSDPIGKTEIIDFATKTGSFNTLQSSSGNSYTLNSTGLTANRVKVGNFYITPLGVFLGNPTNVLTTVQIIDQNGKYLGPIGLSQITDLESLNFRSIGEGRVAYDTVATGYTGQMTGASINSFASYWNTPPLFTGTG